MVPQVDIPPQDEKPWVRVLERLLTGRTHYEQLAEASRAAALAYAKSLNAGPFEQYLERILECPPRRGDVRQPQSRSSLSDERRRLLALRLRSAKGRSTRAPRIPMLRGDSSSASRESLARQATEIARAALPGVDIEIFWDQMWVRRVGQNYFPDPDMFRLPEPPWSRWANQAGKYLRDAEDYWFYLYKPRPGDTIVDIGAGRGEDVFAFSRAVGPSGRVWAVEPHPVSFDVLRRFCELNHLSNVIPLHYACVDRPGPLQIETLPVWESSYVRAGNPSARSSPVKGFLFDDLAAEHGIGHIDFLKMNIEGAERLALPGCAATLRRTQVVCVAAHDFRAERGEGDEFRTLAFVKAFLSAAGFCIVMREDPRYYVPYHVHGERR